MKAAVIVTGGSKGIGLGIVKAFLRTQHPGSQSNSKNFFCPSWETVVNVSRSSCLTHTLGQAGDCNPLGKTPLESGKNPLITEVLGSLLERSTRTQVCALTQGLVTQGYAHICVVHNFGQTLSRHILDTAPADLRDIVTANIEIPFEMTHELSRYMPKGSQHIYIGSQLSFQGAPHSAAYAISKHGLLGLMRSASFDLAPHGIRCNLIAPGFTDTDMGHAVLAYEQRRAKKTLQSTPTETQPLLRTEEVGNLVRFVAENPGLHGESITMSGGQQYSTLPLE